MVGWLVGRFLRAVSRALAVRARTLRASHFGSQPNTMTPWPSRVTGVWPQHRRPRHAPFLFPSAQTPARETDSSSRSARGRHTAIPGAQLEAVAVIIVQRVLPDGPVTVMAALFAQVPAVGALPAPVRRHISKSVMETRLPNRDVTRTSAK